MTNQTLPSCDYDYVCCDVVGVCVTACGCGCGYCCFFDMSSLVYCCFDVSSLVYESSPACCCSSCCAFHCCHAADSVTNAAEVCSLGCVEVAYVVIAGVVMKAPSHQHELVTHPVSLSARWLAHVLCVPSPV